MTAIKNDNPKKLSVREEFKILAAKLRDREKLTLGEVLDFLKENAYHFMIILLCLPFVQPVPMMGLSSILGFVIALIGLSFAMGRMPKLPKKILDVKLPDKFMYYVFLASEKVFSFLEKFIKSRLVSISTNKLIARVSGGFIFVAALLLMLPIPIPFTNTLPTYAILVITIGELEEDGLLIIGGYLMFVATVIYFLLLLLGSLELVHMAV